MNATTVTAAKCSTHPSHRALELHAPPIDRDRLLERCLDNVDFALDLLEAFESTCPARLAAFDAALAERNHDAIADETHKFKGVVSILGGNTLMRIFLNMEAATKDADWNQTRDLIQQLHHEVRRTIDFIPNIRAPA